MYERFYGLQTKPFQLTPNSNFLFLSPKHQNALTYLEYGLLERSEFILLTGDIGAGKTTIVRHILSRIENDIEILSVNNTNVDSLELLSLVLHELGDDQNYDSKAKSLEAIFKHLIRFYTAGKRVILVIDEAQNLSLKSLEEVRMLSNLQTDDYSLLQIMLVGQPNLRQRLQTPELAQLAQRIAVHYHLEALEESEVRDYIIFRLEMAGGSADIFADETFEPISQASGGIPRVINVLCDTALVYGYADSVQQINSEIITKVVHDKEGFGLLPNSVVEEVTLEGQGEEEKDPVSERIEVIEQHIALLQQQMEALRAENAALQVSGSNRLVEELTELLRCERANSDRLLFEYSSLKARINDEMPLTSMKERQSPADAAGPTPPGVVGNGIRLERHEPESSGENEQSNTEQFIQRLSGGRFSMIDLHCHILPMIDDGPDGFEESMAMVKLAVEDGIAVMVATPHLNEEFYQPMEISRRVFWLNHLIRQKKCPLTLMSGADVSVQFSPDQVRGFTINNTDYILLDFPHDYLPKEAGEILSNFVSNGYKPIITHPEHNPSILANPSLLQELLGPNIYVQVTAGSLTGEFGGEAQLFAIHLLRTGKAHVIASAAHSATDRKPILSAGMEVAASVIGLEAAKKLVFDIPAKIIAGQVV